MAFGIGGNAISLSASSSKGQGQGDGFETTYTNTHVNAVNQAKIQSGGDTTLKGTTAQAGQITIIAAFGPQASKAWGDYADGQQRRLQKQAQQASAAGNPERAQQLQDQADGWGEGGADRAKGHAVIGALAGGAAGALGAGGASLAAPALDALQGQLEGGLLGLGLSPEAAQGVAGVATAGTSATLAGLAGGAAAAGSSFNADLNNRQLHPSERKLAQDLARKSGGKYTTEQIEEQMRLMGHKAFKTEPDTVAVLIGAQIAQSRDGKHDPVPIYVQGNAALEVPGSYNPEIQQYILANTSDWMPGESAYVGSKPPVIVTGTRPPSNSPTVKSGNSDLDCKSGAGVQQSSVPELTDAARSAIADAAADASRASGVIAAGATAVAAQAGPYGKPAAVVATGAMGVGVAADAVEQAVRPDMGQTVHNSLTSYFKSGLIKNFQGPLR